MLYSGGVIRIRCLDPELHPVLLLALLNTRIARQQMRAFQFTRDVIDTLGKRVDEIVLPFPRSLSLRQAIVDEVGAKLTLRANLRLQSRLLGDVIESGDTSCLLEFQRQRASLVADGLANLSASSPIAGTRRLA